MDSANKDLKLKGETITLLGEISTWFFTLESFNTDEDLGALDLAGGEHWKVMEDKIRQLLTKLGGAKWNTTVILESQLDQLKTKIKESEDNIVKAHKIVNNIEENIRTIK